MKTSFKFCWFIPLRIFWNFWKLDKYEILLYQVEYQWAIKNSLIWFTIGNQMPLILPELFLNHCTKSNLTWLLHQHTCMMPPGSCISAHMIAQAYQTQRPSRTPACNPCYLLSLLKQQLSHKPPNALLSHCPATPKQTWAPNLLPNSLTIDSTICCTYSNYFMIFSWCNHSVL